MSMFILTCILEENIFCSIESEREKLADMLFKVQTGVKQDLFLQFVATIQIFFFRVVQ